MRPLRGTIIVAAALATISFASSCMAPPFDLGASAAEIMEDKLGAPLLEFSVKIKEDLEEYDEVIFLPTREPLPVDGYIVAYNASSARAVFAGWDIGGYYRVSDSIGWDYGPRSLFYARAVTAVPGFSSLLFLERERTLRVYRRQAATWNLSSFYELNLPAGQPVLGAGAVITAGSNTDYFSALSRDSLGTLRDHFYFVDTATITFSSMNILNPGGEHIQGPGFAFSPSNFFYGEEGLGYSLRWNIPTDPPIRVPFRETVTAVLAAGTQVSQTETRLAAYHPLGERLWDLPAGDILFCHEVYDGFENWVVFSRAIVARDKDSSRVLVKAWRIRSADFPDFGK